MKKYLLALSFFGTLTAFYFEPMPILYDVKVASEALNRPLNPRNTLDKRVEQPKNIDLADVYNPNNQSFID